MNESTARIRTVAAVTIGCRLNQADTALIYDRFTQHGFDVVDVDSGMGIDVLIVNSCTVTATAGQKSRQAVRRLRKQHPECCLVITGCSTETDQDVWSTEATVDLVVTNTQKPTIVDRVLEFLGDSHFGTVEHVGRSDMVFHENAHGYFPFRSRAFLKVQDGCNSFCSYCIVPYARGRERSRHWDEVLEDFERLLSRGYPEIVLTGVNISTYESDGKGLHDLVAELAGFAGDFRLRLSSTEPHPENIQMLRLMAENPKVCRFLHLPLQHGTDRILQEMNRNYTIEDYRQFVSEARRQVPGIHLGTDLIVGFPGETDELFLEMKQLVSELAFANVHIFSYSKREGTPAANFPNQVNGRIAKQRYQALTEVADAGKRRFAESQVGEQLDVILETEQDDGSFLGWSDNYVRVCATGEGLKKGERVQATAKCLGDDLVLAAVVETSA